MPPTLDGGNSRWKTHMEGKQFQIPQPTTSKCLPSPCFRFFTCKVEGTEVSLHRSSILEIRHTALGNAQNGGHVGSVMHAEVFKLSGFQCGTGEEEDNLEAQETMVMFQAPTKDYET